MTQEALTQVLTDLANENLQLRLHIAELTHKLKAHEEEEASSD